MNAVPVPARAPVLAPPRAALRRMPDESVARWAARGSEAAFAVIFERHHQALHRYCHSIVGNGHDASDALQSTMLKAFRALTGETREITLRPWLYRIAHNESISLLRARRSDSDLEAAAHIGDPATEGLVESRERLRALASDLTELTEQQRGALLMRELGGLEFAEVAVALGISATAAKQSVYESRCVLHALQEGRDMDCDVVRRTLSDGDRRMLRGKRLRGHLRFCAGCQDFERALRERPAHLAALAPPLPMAAAAAMLHGLLGGGVGGFGAGGGLVASLTGGAKGVAGVSLATKVAAVAVVGTTIVGGGAAVVVPDRGAGAKPATNAPATAQRTAAPRVSVAHAPTRAAEAALRRAEAARAGTPANGVAKGRSGTTSADDPGRGASNTAGGAGAARSAAARARRGPSATALARRAERAAAARARAVARRAAGKPASRTTPRPMPSAAARARAKAEAQAKALERRARPAAPSPGASTPPTSPRAGAERRAGSGTAVPSPR